MKNIKIEFTNECIIPASGLAVLGAIQGKSDFVKRCNRMDDIGVSLRSQILAENIEMLKSNGIVPGKLANG